jgi:hypothetical protein
MQSKVFLAEVARPKRRSTRLVAALPVMILRGDRVVSASATDINRHGMFLRTEVPTPLNYVVQIEVHLPEDLPFRALAWAKSASRSAGDGFGLEFFSIEPAHREKWEEYYRRQLKSARSRRESTGRHRAYKK